MYKRQVQSKLEYTLEKARSARNHKLVFFNDIVKTNGCLLYTSKKQEHTVTDNGDAGRDRTAMKRL